jgi:hypothetical protein
MAFDAATAARRGLVVEQHGEQAHRRPAFLVGLGRERGQDLFDGGQQQLGEQQLDAGGVPTGQARGLKSHGIGRLHAAPPGRTVPSSS